MLQNCRVAHLSLCLSVRVDPDAFWGVSGSVEGWVYYKGVVIVKWEGAFCG